MMKLIALAILLTLASPVLFGRYALVADWIIEVSALMFVIKYVTRENQ